MPCELIVKLGGQSHFTFQLLPRASLCEVPLLPCRDLRKSIPGIGTIFDISIYMFRRTAFFIVALLASRLEGQDLYVSTSGSDSNSGTSTAPFATINKARLAVRSLSSTSGLD